MEGEIQRRAGSAFSSGIPVYFFIREEGRGTFFDTVWKHGISVRDDENERTLVGGSLMMLILIMYLRISSLLERFPLTRIRFVSPGFHGFYWPRFLRFELVKDTSHILGKSRLLFLLICLHFTRWVFL